MAKTKEKQVFYQCLRCGKAFRTEEEAIACHDAPVHSFIKGHDRWPKLSFWGNHRG